MVERRIRMDITWSVVVGTRNTPHLIKGFIERWKKVVPNGEHHLVIVDSGNDSETEMLLNDEKLNNSNIWYYVIDDDSTLSDTYNFGAKKCKTEFISFLHNDIWLPDGYFEKLSNSFELDKICITRRIEPIFFANSISNETVKYIDCGTSWDTINEDRIYKSMNTILDKYGYRYFNFFISFHRSLYTEVGGMDNLFDPMFCEDDDIHKRWCMLGKEFKLMGNVQFYHMPSQTSRYSKEYEFKTKAIEDNSNKNFFRKWGTKTQNIKLPKITNALIAAFDSTCNNDEKFNHIMTMNEMFFSFVYFIVSDDHAMELVKEKIYEWLTEEQKYTQIDLSNKVKAIKKEDLSKVLKDDKILYSIVYKKSINISRMLDLNDLVVNNQHVGKYMIDSDNVLIIHQEINIDNFESQVKIDRTNRIDINLWKRLKKERVWKRVFSN